jgi:hypothetical protein
MTDPPPQHRAAERDPAAPRPEEADRELATDVDGASEASFPASDPPAWMGMRVGGPLVRDDARTSDRAS